MFHELNTVLAQTHAAHIERHIAERRRRTGEGRDPGWETTAEAIVTRRRTPRWRRLNVRTVLRF